MDLAADSQEAYVLFTAPRDTGSRAPRPPRSPRRPSGPRPPPLGWWVAGFYGLILGALTVGLTAGAAPQAVVKVSIIALAAVVAAQSVLTLSKHADPLAVRLAQGLTTPAVALVAAGLGALARLT